MSSSSKPTFSSSSEEEGLLLALACHCTMTSMTESSGEPLKGIHEYPSGPGLWHKCLIEAVRDGAGENRQRGLLLAGAPQTGRVRGYNPTFREQSAPRIGENDINYTRKEGSFWGRKGVPCCYFS